MSPVFRTLLSPAALSHRLRNLRAALRVWPGHFYSALVDVTGVPADGDEVPFDGPDYWACVDLRPDAQRAYFADLLASYRPPPFPAAPAGGRRYHTNNGLFEFADAFTLAGVLRKEGVGRVVEVGSGFSTAVMLDTAEATGRALDLVCIEPHPAVLRGRLTPADADRVTVIESPVQQVPMATFDGLGPGDVLFVDSTHVAKVGSDVAHLILRVLPRLRPGVLVHFHDIFYPHSYPAAWLRGGRSWNESLFLRAFLAGNASYQVVAFNSFAGKEFAGMFSGSMSAFLADTGGSLWLRRVAGDPSPS